MVTLIITRNHHIEYTQYHSCANAVLVVVRNLWVLHVIPYGVYDLVGRHLVSIRIGNVLESLAEVIAFVDYRSFVYGISV